MWFPSTVSDTPAIVEPVDLAQAQEQCNVLSSEIDFSAKLTDLIKVARSHVERYCNARWAEQTIVCQCDSFADFSRLSEGPLKSVTSIKYIDPAGDDQTLADTVFEARKDGLEPSIALNHGQSWPAIRPGSRITLTAVFGGIVPEAVSHAMLVCIEDLFLNRGNTEREGWAVFDVLLCNHRRGV